MSILQTALAVAACAVVLLVVGCTSNKPFRTNFTPCNTASPGANCTNAVIESNADYKLGFVEFDDQGWFWDTRQLHAVTNMIGSEIGLDQPGSPQGIVVVVFTHGWKNNAAWNNTNVQTFRTILKQFGLAETVQTNHPPRKVVGVYAGWRGLSATVQPFTDLTFWSRKATAHKVGGYGAMTELLVRLESLQEAGNQLLPTGAPRTELIIVGHSFGGAAVYSAISQIVNERFVDTIPAGQPLKPLGDQIILLNPAFEASRHYDLNQLAASINKYPTNQRPVLSIFTSKGDWATHYAFPIGRFFATLFQRNRDGLQRQAGRDAVGWYQPFVTHDLIYKTNAASLSASNSTLNPATGKHELHNKSQMVKSYENVRAQRQNWHPNRSHPVEYDFDDTILKPREHYHPGDPFPIVSVDIKIMKDHDDIANPVLINFLGEYIQFCQSDTQEKPK